MLTFATIPVLPTGHNATPEVQVARVHPGLMKDAYRTTTTAVTRVIAFIPSRAHVLIAPRIPSADTLHARRLSVITANIAQGKRISGRRHEAITKGNVYAVRMRVVASGVVSDVKTCYMAASQT